MACVISYRCPKSDYYDGHRTRYYKKAELNFESVVPELENLALKHAMLYEALAYMRHVRRDWTSAEVRDYVNHIVMKVYHGDLYDGSYANSLIGTGIDVERIFFDEEVEHLKDNKINREIERKV